MKKLNWQIWAGFLLSVAAFLSYPLFMLKFDLNLRWASFLLFAVAVALALYGVRRAFASGGTHPLRSKVAGGVLATLSVVILGLFVFTFFIMPRQLPASRSAPQVGQKAPDFTLTDTSGRAVTLADLLSSPIDAAPGSAGVAPAAARAGRTSPKGLLLIFYRGYW